MVTQTLSLLVSSRSWKVWNKRSRVALSNIEGAREAFNALMMRDVIICEAASDCRRVGSIGCETGGDGSEGKRKDDRKTSDGTTRSDRRLAVEGKDNRSHKEEGKIGRGLPAFDEARRDGILYV